MASPAIYLNGFMIIYQTENNVLSYQVSTQNGKVSTPDNSIRLFADDTCLFKCSHDLPVELNSITNDLDNIHIWSSQWLIEFNPIKTISVLFSRRQNPSILQLTMNNVRIKSSPTHKHLGVLFSRNGSWEPHVKYIIGKIVFKLTTFRKLKYVLDRKSLEIIYKSFILPTFDFADCIWDNITIELVSQLEKLNLDALRIITGLPRGTPHQIIYLESGFISLNQRRQIHRLTMLFKLTHVYCPPDIHQLLPRQLRHNVRFNLRHPENYIPLYCKPSTYQNSFLPKTVIDWNNLPDEAKLLRSVPQFKRSLSPTIKPPSWFYSHTNRTNEIFHTR